MDLSILGKFLVDILKTFFWLIADIFKAIAIFIIDFIANLLPDYTVPVPSALFADSNFVSFLNYVFPVDHFIACLTLIVVNMGISFVYGPLLRIIRIRS